MRSGGQAGGAARGRGGGGVPHHISLKVIPTSVARDAAGPYGGLWAAGADVTERPLVRDLKGHPNAGPLPDARGASCAEGGGYGGEFTFHALSPWLFVGGDVDHDEGGGGGNGVDRHGARGIAARRRTKGGGRTDIRRVGGEGSGTQKIVHQKWPNHIFPVEISVTLVGGGEVSSDRLSAVLM